MNDDFRLGCGGCAVEALMWVFSPRVALETRRRREEYRQAPVVSTRAELTEKVWEDHMGWWAFFRVDDRILRFEVSDRDFAAEPGMTGVLTRRAWKFVSFVPDGGRTGVGA